jgi:hypothetical protein
MLAFMVPFLPMFTFMLVALGWLIMVIEAVIISPLWWIMMLQPEGEGIAGSRLERGYGILQALVLKPMLLIIAMIAAIAVARIGFSLFNSVIWDGLDLFTDSGIFEFLGAVMLYTYGSYFIIKMSSGVIQQLPNSVLEWLNSSGRSFGEQEIIGQAEGHMRGGSQQIGGAITGVAGGKNAITGQFGKNNDNQKQKKDHNSMGDGTTTYAVSEDLRISHNNDETSPPMVGVPVDSGVKPNNVMMREAPDKLKPSFVHGQSDGGKGVWSYNSRTSGSDSTWAKYQSQVTGAPDGTEYLVKTDLMSSGQKWFDGYDPNRNVLLDAKRYLDWPKENLPFSVNKVVEDARMESAIAKQLKTKVEWHIPSQEKADLVQQLLRENRIKHINVVYSPIGG